MSTGSSFWRCGFPEFCEASCACQYPSPSPFLSASDTGLNDGEEPKIIEVARQDVLFVDPYLDAEFVSRYLGHVASGVPIRLLARAKLQTLLPAVDAFAKQFQAKIEVRSAPNFHDRYIFIDKNSCYQSGASFKDGAKQAPTTLTQITDAFAAVLQTYEALWNQGKVER